MSWVRLAPPQPRPGHLACICEIEPTTTSGGALAAVPGAASAAAMFALTVLAQALATATLPMAGAILAPTPAWRAAPYAMFLLGAALATLPAALLADRFGRRAGLVLGASLGIGGGALAAHGFAAGQFPGLVLGAVWLGAAQGFGFFYRHPPISRAGNATRDFAFLFGAGVLAAVLAPVVTQLSLVTPGALALPKLLVSTSIAEVAVLVVAIGFQPVGALAATAEQRPIALGRFLAATLAAAGAWFGMTRLMASAAPEIALCGIGMATASGVIANHLLWMYAPAAFAGLWLKRIGAGRGAALGLIVVAGAVFAFERAATTFEFAALMSVAGFGWSFAVSGATALLFENGAPPPRWLAVHDAAFFSAGVAGALSASLPSLLPG
jgi:hypothetical protein